jgi:CheY-like chemotaxis protein
MNRVLVIEDDADNADSLALLLRLAGHRVLVVRDGTMAVAAARGFRPDVVLLDIALPGLDGYEVARRLRREPGLEGTLVVAVSGYGQAQDKRRALEAGCDAHMTKPADPRVLVDMVGGGRPSAGPGRARPGGIGTTHCFPC